MAGSGDTPLNFIGSASSPALAASATDTISGRYRSICSASSSRLPPAASATTPNRPGSASTTDRHCLPIEPVEPKMANFEKGGVTQPFFLVFSNRDSTDLASRRVNQRPIIPDNRDG